MNRIFTIALAGNPNSGKTSIFNSLTDTRQHVGNYPGVTVERKEGTCRHDGMLIRVVDLPGTYSLTAYSIEEVVARNFIIDEQPDVVIDILDVSNLERNLYLAVQLMELGIPLVLAFNMSDVARNRGIEFDLNKLASLLNCTIVPTVGHKGIGMDALLEAAVVQWETRSNGRAITLDYGREIEGERDHITSLLHEKSIDLDGWELSWVALKLLEHDAELHKKITDPEIKHTVNESIQRIEKQLGEPPEIAIADHRYGFISGVYQECVRSTVEQRQHLSERIDAIMRCAL